MGCFTRSYNRRTYCRSHSFIRVCFPTTMRKTHFEVWIAWWFIDTYIHSLPHNCWEFPSYLPLEIMLKSITYGIWIENHLLHIKRNLIFILGYLKNHCCCYQGVLFMIDWALLLLKKKGLCALMQEHRIKTQWIKSFLLDLFN